MIKSYIYIIVCVLITAFVASCNQADPVCPDTQAYNLKVAFYKSTDSTTNRLKFYHPNLPDSLETDNSLSPLVNVPVDPSSDSTAFYIDFIIENDSVNSRETDMISIIYTSNLFLDNQECGFIMDFEITDGYYSQNAIDSVSWVYNLINEDNEINLEVYY